MNSRIKWGVLGFARIARNSVIPAILQANNAAFHAIASRDAEKLQACQAQFGPQKTYRSYDALLDDANIQAVYIPLPNSLHKEWVIKAALKGKHILCEKPLALSAADAQEMIDVCQLQGVTLMEAFMYRYTARTKQVQEIVQSGELGEIKSINSTFGILLTNEQSIKWQPELGGGSLYDVGSYPVNFVGMLAQADPVSVSAEFVMQNKVDSMAIALLRYQNGLIATVNSWFTAARTVESAIMGTKGKLIVPDTFSGNEGKLTLITTDRERKITVPASDRYLLEVQDFSDALLQKRPPLFSLQESLRNMRAIDQILACKL
ncbi:MAG: Gfo/Idh/MocA family oxidoreductase [Anaerolineaceae bacterium]|nr:Gfo/Idh/MocA family oxidoreductase [Anaerolineaceae bacterium]